MNPPLGTIRSSEQEAQQRQVKEILLEAQTANFGHAQTYTTVVIFGGYAGIFGVWSFTRDSLGAGVNVWVGLLIGISVLTFVLFEIFGMVFRSIEQIKVRKLLIANLSPEQFLSKHQSLANESNLKAQKIVVPVWIAALVISISTGVGGAIILLYCFGAALFAGIP